MRIPCPHCGERGVEEFAYHGDAKPNRPPMDAAVEEWTDYVYLRDNIAGDMRELWYHAAGCRAWLVVTRSTATHAISSVECAAP
jgi:heterotetrameric sarcosine oxidase delta subunit